MLVYFPYVAAKTHDVVLDELISRLEEVKNSYGLSKRFCMLALDLKHNHVVSMKKNDNHYVIEHGEPLSILSKYVPSSTMYKPNSVGEIDILDLHQCRTLLHHVCHCWFVLLHRIWYIWFLWLVINEVVCLIIGGIPKACHMELCWKLIWIQQTRIETSTCKRFLFS